MKQLNTLLIGFSLLCLVAFAVGCAPENPHVRVGTNCQKSSYLSLVEAIYEQNEYSNYVLRDSYIYPLEPSETDNTCFGFYINAYSREFVRENRHVDNFQYGTEGDPFIESQIKDFISRENTKISMAPGVNLEFVEYRMEPCISIILLKNGEDITDKIRFIKMISHQPYTFIFNTNHELVSYIQTGMTVDDYMGYSPLIVPMAFFSINEPVISGDVLQMKVTLGDGTILEDTIVASHGVS